MKRGDVTSYAEFQFVSPEYDHSTQKGIILVLKRTIHSRKHESVNITLKFE